MPGNTHDSDYVFLFELHAIQKRNGIRVTEYRPSFIHGWFIGLLFLLH